MLDPRERPLTLDVPEGSVATLRLDELAKGTGLPDASRDVRRNGERDLADTKERLRITQDRVERLEQLCDEFNADLPDLRSFVLPGGAEAAARLHFARTVCRRAERAAVIAARQGSINPLVLAYLNRLSDLLFILARAANASAGRDEPLWKPGVS